MKDLSGEDKQRYRDDFIEDGTVPDFIRQAAKPVRFNRNHPWIPFAGSDDPWHQGCQWRPHRQTIIFAPNQTPCGIHFRRFNKLY